MGAVSAGSWGWVRVRHVDLCDIRAIGRGPVAAGGALTCIDLTRPHR
ncbi:hypothetical protein ACWGB8_03380 [Kitasatospora sp. NPDC054939]